MGGRERVRRHVKAPEIFRTRLYARRDCETTAMSERGSDSSIVRRTRERALPSTQRPWQGQTPRSSKIDARPPAPSKLDARPSAPSKLDARPSTPRGLTPLDPVDARRSNLDARPLSTLAPRTLAPGPPPRSGLSSVADPDCDDGIVYETGEWSNALPNVE
jgi:hypothetical protein